MNSDDVIQVNESLMNASVLPNSLTLSWKDYVGCPRQLTTIILRLWQDGLVPPKKRKDSSSELTTEIKPITYIIPQSCLTQLQNRSGFFFLHLSPSPLLSTCNTQHGVEWKPLDSCRKYVLEVESLYSLTSSTGPSTSQTIFTSKQGNLNSFMNMCCSCRHYIATLYFNKYS